ncbi:hypothetical protein D9613_012444 [Agrocybe pediades]|uniref:Type 1 phosphatases regulator n=1 Tax=Agrocybe pediades TaxID=84607 RepID=A0A8H4QRH5_9AGAR|nr:hypothetical protein D9613_012444 [Agrocybe pediades]
MSDITPRLRKWVFDYPSKLFLTSTSTLNHHPVFQAIPPFPLPLSPTHTAIRTMDLSNAMRSRGPNAGTPTDGSRTMTITRDPTKEHPASDDENEGQGPGGQVVGTLHLRGARRAINRPRVAWNEEVIDNEGCGKKKSKSVMLHNHKPRLFDKSSDESDSDSDSDSFCSGNPAHNHANHLHIRNPSPHAGLSSQQSRSNGESGTAECVREAAQGKTKSVKMDSCMYSMLQPTASLDGVLLRKHGPVYSPPSQRLPDANTPNNKAQTRPSPGFPPKRSTRRTATVARKSQK